MSSRPREVEGTTRVCVGDDLWCRLLVVFLWCTLRMLPGDPSHVYIIVSSHNLCVVCSDLETALSDKTWNMLVDLD